MKWMQFLTPVKSKDVIETQQMISDHDPDEITILDVRQSGEYKESHIPGAVLIPLPELSDRASELDPDKPTLVYWAVGGRSRVAAQMLAGKGFKQVYNVSGGIKAWRSKTAVGPQTLGMDLFEGRESVTDFLVIAYSMEQGLQRFYQDMAGQARNDAVKDLFGRLADIEVKHQDQVFDRYQKMVDPAISREGFEAMVTMSALEGGLTTKQYLDLFAPDLSVETEVVSMAMSIEAQALDLYQRVAAQVTDPDARAVVLQIAGEENHHLARLGKLMDRLKGPV